MKLTDVSIMCISLDRRPDRWAYMQGEAKKAGITNMRRLPAVDAKKFEPHKHPKISLLTSYNIYYGVRRSHYEIDAGGAIGASLSHIAAWEKLLASSAPAMIVFEDDIELKPGLTDRLTQVISQLPAEWDVVQFENTNFGNGVHGCKPDPAMAPWYNCTSLMGAHAYMISRSGAKKLLEKAYPIEMHIDAYMAFMSRMGHIKMIWNPLIQIDQAGQTSDIAHGDCMLCNVPTDMEKKGYVALQNQSVIGLMAMATVAGGLLALAFVRR
jgi:glycosyl transferase family 25